MKKTAFLLPLATALLLSACNNADDHTATTDSKHTPENSEHNKVIERTENIQAPMNDDINSQRYEVTDAYPEPATNTTNNDGNKKDVVKFMYRDAVLSLKEDDDIDDINILFAYADRELQNAIGLVKADAMSQYEGNDDITKCNAVRYITNLSVDNSYTIDEVADIKYKVLDNGKIRASILLEGDENIEASGFDSYRDFSLRCSSEGCKITDMFNSYGDSALQAVEEACR